MKISIKLKIDLKLAGRPVTQSYLYHCPSACAILVYKSITKCHTSRSQDAL